MRCIAGQIKRNFGSKDILKLVVKKSSQNKIWCNTIKIDFFAAHRQIFIPSRDKQTSRHNKVCQIWKFHRKCHQQTRNPVMLGHDDDDTRHHSYDPRKFPNMWLNSQSDFALLFVRYWICHEVSVFLWTRKFFLRSPSFILDGHATPMWSVAWYEHKKTAVT